ncbi:hypothetical protein AAVH_32093, partial [Aphelenchoides avenae]
MSPLTAIFEQRADGYHYRMLAPLKKTIWGPFQMRRPFRAEYLDSTTHVVTMSYDSRRDTLVFRHDLPEEPGSPPDLFEYTIDRNGDMTMA